MIPYCPPIQKRCYLVTHAVGNHVCALCGAHGHQIQDCPWQDDKPEKPQ